MTDSDKGEESAAPAAESPPNRRTSSTRKKPARRRGRKPARAKSSAATRRSRSRTKRAASLQAMLESLAQRASEAGGRVADLSGEGAVAARRALGKASTASRRAIDRLTREWKQMDTAKKAKFVAALLAALAAASAPLVRGRRRK